jgi:hypothetical protein
VIVKMNLIQALLSAFWLLTLAKASVDFLDKVAANPLALTDLADTIAVTPEIALGAGSVGGGAALEIPGITSTPPAPPVIVPFPSDIGGISNIFSSAPDVTHTTIAAGAGNTNAVDNPTPVDNPTGIYSAVWITTTVSAFVTICPAPTTLVHGVETYTITDATTLTITSRFLDRSPTVPYPD